jgi:hypothetical protein
MKLSLYVCTTQAFAAADYVVQTYNLDQQIFPRCQQKVHEVSDALTTVVPHFIAGKTSLLRQENGTASNASDLFQLAPAILCIKAAIKAKPSTWAQLRATAYSSQFASSRSKHGQSSADHSLSALRTADTGCGD